MQVCQPAHLGVYYFDLPLMKGAKYGVHAGHVANHLVGRRATQILALIRAWGGKFVKLTNAIG